MIDKDLQDFDTPGHALNANGMMLLMGTITDESVKPVIEWILFENHVKKRRVKELLLMVCSEGGNITSAFALIDVIRSSKIPIKTVGLGEISSAGLLIFISGHTGRRILTPNTSILSHQFAWHSAGKAHELFATVKEFELTHQRMINLYRVCTGLDDKQIAKILLPPQDVYLSAEEAREYNICDHVADI